MTRTSNLRLDTLPRIALGITLLSLPLFAGASSAQAQEQPPASNQAENCSAARGVAADTRTFYLADTAPRYAQGEVSSALHNALCSDARVYDVESERAIVVQALPDQLDLAAKIIHDLDRPQTSYRLTYTLTELNAGKTISTEHYSMVLASGQQLTLKQGTKVPVATGSYSNANASANNSVETQFTYLDIGMNFVATVEPMANGVQLHSKIEQSSLAQPSTIEGVTEPVVSQTVLETTSLLSPDKPRMLGAIDIPHSTRHIDIAAVIEPLK
jgi:type II secretory pathway component GspD/PulD (secretin)